MSRSLLDDALVHMRQPRFPFLFLLLFATWAGPVTGAEVTFSRNIAPIVFRECASCHRAGQSAPFELLNYAQVAKRAKDIAEVTRKRIMPPWLPEKGVVTFQHARTLSDAEISIIQEWAAQGAPEGDPRLTPPLPQFPGDWQLGQPDLILTMPQPYLLPAEGKDVYRNFVLPIPIPTRKFVRAVEFRGNNRSIHHAFLRIDRTRQSRRLDEAEPGPGFGGMDNPTSAQSPDGHFLSWQPGKIATPEDPGLAWTLETHSDLVLQLHLQPTGKKEPVQSSVGFFFTGQAPTNAPFKIGLGSYTLDIPAGATNYLVTDSYTLPVDLRLLRILPHAHYLAREMRGFAVLPDGTRKWLLLIKDWNFNWQSDYEYQDPVFLPKGSKITMEFIYDNSTNNIRNPFHPPQRVRYGVQTTDEMGELWIQVLPKDRPTLQALKDNYQSKVIADLVQYYQYALTQNPNDAKSLTQLGKAMLYFGRKTEADQLFQKAIQANPNYDEAHYHLGIMAEQQKNLKLAETEYRAAISANPENFKAMNNLALLFLDQNRVPEAKAQLDRAIQVESNDGMLHDNLGLVYYRLRRLPAAEHEFKRALELDPDNNTAREHLAAIEQVKTRPSR